MSDLRFWEKLGHGTSEPSATNLASQPVSPWGHMWFFFSEMLQLGSVTCFTAHLWNCSSTCQPGSFPVHVDCL